MRFVHLGLSALWHFVWNPKLSLRSRLIHDFACAGSMAVGYNLIVGAEPWYARLFMLVGLLSFVVIASTRTIYGLALDEVAKTPTLAVARIATAQQLLSVEDHDEYEVKVSIARLPDLLSFPGNLKKVSRIAMTPSDGQETASCFISGKSNAMLFKLTWGGA